MSQFNVHRLAEGLVLNCQSDLLEQIDSRFVVPLVPRSEAPKIGQRLNPMFEIEGKEYVMLTQAAAAVRRRELGAVVSSLAEHSFQITGALHILLSGI